MTYFVIQHDEEVHEDKDYSRTAAETLLDSLFTHFLQRSEVPREER